MECRVATFFFLIVCIASVLLPSPSSCSRPNFGTRSNTFSHDANAQSVTDNFGAFANEQSDDSQVYILSLLISRSFHPLIYFSQNLVAYILYCSSFDQLFRTEIYKGVLRSRRRMENSSNNRPSHSQCDGFWRSWQWRRWWFPGIYAYIYIHAFNF